MIADFFIQTRYRLTAFVSFCWKIKYYNNWQLLIYIRGLITIMKIMQSQYFIQVMTDFQKQAFFKKYVYRFKIKHEWQVWSTYTCFATLSLTNKHILTNTYSQTHTHTHKHTHTLSIPLFQSLSLVSVKRGAVN